MMDAERQAWLQYRLTELRRHIDETALALRHYGTVFEASLARAGSVANVHLR